MRFRDELLWRNAPRRVRIDLARGVAVGWGRDTFPARTAIRVTATSFADQIDGSPRSDQIDAGRGSDQIHARAGDDQIQNARDRTAPAVGDRIFAGAGDDHIDYTFGLETGQVVSAGAGIDFATVHDNQVNPFGRRRPATGFFDMQTGQVTYQAGQQRVEFALHGVEGVFIGEEDSANRPLRALAAWQVAGTEGNDRVDGGSTNGTTFDALGGDDTFTSSPGQDSYDGGPGDDLAINMGSRRETDACQNVERFETSTACSNTSP